MVTTRTCMHARAVPGVDRRFHARLIIKVGRPGIGTAAGHQFVAFGSGQPCTCFRSSTSMQELSEMIIDAQVHCYEANTPARPW
jgi:hypothetical protein